MSLKSYKSDEEQRREASLNNQLAFDYAAYMIIGSYFTKATCKTPNQEKRLFIRYNDLKADKQVDLENLCTRYVDNELYDLLPKYFWNQEVTVRLIGSIGKNNTTIIFEGEEDSLYIEGLYDGFTKKVEFKYELKSKANNQNNEEEKSEEEKSQEQIDQSYAFAYAVNCVMGGYFADTNCTAEDIEDNIQSLFYKLSKKQQYEMEEMCEDYAENVLLPNVPAEIFEEAVDVYFEDGENFESVFVIFENDKFSFAIESVYGGQGKGAEFAWGLDWKE